MEKRSHCGSGGCMTCPFSLKEEADIVYNYACLPTVSNIMRMKEKSNHNWACHSNENVLCGGFVKYVNENRSDLSIKEGNLISYETWYHNGETAALEEASKNK